MYMERYRLKFEKLGNMRFIGHLDTVALFQRCLKLAQLPISYSKGYHPRQEVAFALPLGLGIAGTGEFVDIQLDREILQSDIIDGLNAHFPIGIKIIGARQLEPNERIAPRIVIAAEYEIIVHKNIEPQIYELLNNEEVIVIKKSKSGEKPVNIRPLIFEATYENNKLRTVLATGERNLKPQLLMEYLMPGAENIYYTRTDILKEGLKSL